MSTVLSGVSGAFYYKPAGTLATFGTAEVTFATALFNVGVNFNFKPGDPVQFRIRNALTGAIGTGTLPAGITAGTTYYVIGYNSSTGVLTVSSSPTLAPIITLTSSGVLAAPNRFEIFYGSLAVVAECRDWTVEFSRAEIDVTSIGRTLGQFVPFRNYISGFGDANGSANIYMTDEDLAMANRMVQDVLLRKQIGASVKLYVERVEASGVVDDTKSRSIEMDIVLTSASLNVNPDDAQSVAINFRPFDNVNFDFTTT